MLRRLTREEIESAVRDKIHAILRARCSDVVSLDGGDNLNAKLGLSSLDLAFLVAELEVDLDLDPFSQLVDITSIKSVDELIRAYHNAAFAQTPTQGVDKAYAEATQRARARRDRRKRS
jgi:acyl carrier protein